MKQVEKILNYSLGFVRDKFLGKGWVTDGLNTQSNTLFLLTPHDLSTWMVFLGFKFLFRESQPP